MWHGHSRNCRKLQWESPHQIYFHPPHFPLDIITSSCYHNNMMIEPQSTGSASPTGLALHHSGEEMHMEIVNDKYNGVRIVKNADGKYGIEDLLAGGPVKFRYRTLELATEIATAVSAENDRLDN